MEEEIKKNNKAEETTENKEAEKTTEEKKTKKPIVKKEKAIINVKSIPISTVQAKYICKFIKNKKIEEAIADLEEVLKKRKAIPMAGEVAHRKGKIMSGKFPLVSTNHFIKLLKTLQANSNVNGLDDPLIAEAMANIASRPYGRFGRIRRKRTHIKIIAKDKQAKKEEK